MARRAGWMIGLPAAIALTVVLPGAGPATANGYCGADPTGATACPVSTNTTLSGSIASGSGQDYYVFYVARKTDLELTVTDTENAQCSNDYPYYPYICGWAQAELLNSVGHELGDTQTSSPQNGVTVPQSISGTLPRGVYYVDVSGYQGDGTLPAIPYQLTVSGNPSVQWPPACIVPRLRHDTSLGRAKHLVRDNRCTVGPVHYVRSATPRGDVVRLAPGAGSIRAYAAPVTIYVSGTPHRRRRHHKK